ncbi:MAG: archease [bacterium]|nr:archease [bacterium]
MEEKDRIAAQSSHTKVNPQKEYEYIEHTGDIGVRVFGSDLAELFENASKAFFDILTEREKITPCQKKQIVVEKSGGWERLLVAWLSELLYLFEVDLWLFQTCNINSLTDQRLEAICLGEVYDPDRHEIKTAIKAVTHHRLCLQKVNERWEATIIFDI